jgi:Uma2 family endonuclease
MSTDSYPQPQFAPVVGEPAWDVALLYPVQGAWSEQDYLDIALTQNKLVEYSQGCVEFLPMPTIEHQLLVKFLLKALEGFTEPRKLGMVLFAPLPVWLNPGEYREPDLIFNFAENHAKRAKKYYEHADLVMEVVSDDKRSHQRDYESKRRDYAQAGIAEYWIVDPAKERVTVLSLERGVYIDHAVVEGAGQATSKLLEGFVVDATALFAAGKV